MKKITPAILALFLCAWGHLAFAQMASFFPGPGMPATSGGGTAFGITQTATPNTTTGTSGVNTFAGIAIGTADATRIVSVTIGHGASSAALSAFTIGGVTATQRAVSAFSGGSICEIWDAPVPTGAIATIQFTQSVADTRIVMGVYRIVGTGLSFSAGSANTQPSGNSLTTSVTIPAGGGAIAHVITHNSASGVGTPTNLTLDSSNLVVGNSTSYIGNNTTSSGSTTIGVTWGGAATDAAEAVAAYNP